jgi:hypothetical protein
MPAKQFVEVGMNAMNPAKQFATYKTKYDAGKCTPEEMAEYVLLRGHTCLPSKDEMAKYFATQKDADLTKSRNWDILSQNASDLGTDSREFRYLTAHKEEFDKLYTSEHVDEVIKSTYYYSLNRAIKGKNMDRYNALRAEVLKNIFSFSEEMVLSTDMTLYKSTKDWKNYAQTAVRYSYKFKKEDYNTLNKVAWDFYENVSDKAMLEKAEGWIKHSVELKPGYFNYDTYAAVLYKLGKKLEAKEAAEKAIELAKAEGQEYTSTQEMLDKLNAMG